MTLHTTGGFQDQPWADRALCAQTDPDAFFPEKGGSTRDPKKVCLSCEVRTECLDWALATDQAFGIWGGHSERERRKLKKDRHADALAATGTDGPSYDAADQAVDEHAEQPAPKSYGLAYVGGTGGHRPVPLATDIGVRPAHTPKTPRATGLDWSKHTAPEPTVDQQQPVAISWPCRGCGQKSGELVKDLCPSCRDAVDAKFTVPTAVPDLPTEGNQGQPTTGSSAPGATSTSSQSGRAPARAAGSSTPKVKNPEVAQETRPAATSGALNRPAYVDDIVAVMVATEGHPDPVVRAARKVVANALVTLHKTLAGVFPHTPAAAPTAPVPPSAGKPGLPDAAAGTTRPKKTRKAPAGRRGPRGNPHTEAAIVRLYTGDENLSCPQIAERLNIGVKAVRSALDRAGIQRVDGRSTHSGGKPKDPTTDDPQLVANVRRLYLEEQLTQAEVAHQLGTSTKAVQTLMLRHQIPARPPAHKIATSTRPSKLTDAQVDELCTRYQAGESGSTLAKAYGVSLPTILDRLRGRGVTIRSRGGHHPAPSTSNPSGATTA